MENMAYQLPEDGAERLAIATVEQLTYRITAKKVSHPLFDKNKFCDFYLSLRIPAKLSGGLVLSEHKKLYDLPKEFMQYYEIRDPMPISFLEVYPRGVIVPSEIENDISKSKHKSLSYKIRAEIARLNRRLSPKITGGKHGKHVFASEIAYMKMLRDKDMAEMLSEEAKKKEPYFGFIRVNYNHLKPRSMGPGWLDPKEVEWLKSFPVIIIPEITTEKLEVMVNKEIKILGF